MWSPGPPAAAPTDPQKPCSLVDEDALRDGLSAAAVPSYCSARPPLAPHAAPACGVRQLRPAARVQRAGPPVSAGPTERLRVDGRVRHRPARQLQDVDQAALP
ncbi:hypothetical protein GCM10010440_73370 [Kitasatospora cinereorecta]